MSHDTGSAPRPAKVSKELANAAYDDFKRKAIDEAKKRAVTQRVDYDTFKNMVLTAHLKPIGAPNKREDNRPLPCWNFGVDGQLLKQQLAQAHLPPTTPTEAPSTSGDFYRDWRRNCPSQDDKYRYLKLCGPEGLRQVFKVEVSAEVLKDVLAVMGACWLGHAGAAEEAEEAAQQQGAEAGPGEGDAGRGQACGGAALREAALVVHMLAALASAGRFSLTVKLLGSGVKPMLQSLFDGLTAAVAAGEAAATAAGDGDDVDGDASATGLCSAEQLAALRTTYGVPA